MAAALAVAATGCGVLGVEDDDAGPDGEVTITLAGPNQWNAGGKSFGPAWEKAVAKFEKREPGITVETQVLPLDGFMETTTTQLAAGTAPELVFNQPPHKAAEVHALDRELRQPNPYIKGNKRWLDAFIPEYFGPEVSKALSRESGKLEYIPFNLVGPGLYYNKDLFDEVGIEAPLETWEDFRAAVKKLEEADHIAVGQDNSHLSLAWTWEAITAQLVDKHYDEWNAFTPAGEPGTAPNSTLKSTAKAVKEGKVKASDPEVVESLKIYKEFFDAATPNWTGINSEGPVVGYRDFIQGKAAMGWGTNFAVDALNADADFAYGMMPFPTITKETTSVSTDTPARYGVSVGGTSYMIPSTTKGEKYEAAVKFLQFMTSPEAEDWLQSTGGIPAVKGIEAGSETEGLLDGEWGKEFHVWPLPDAPEGTLERDVFDGFLLGDRSLKEQQSNLQDWWDKYLDAEIKKNAWEDEDWAK